MVSEGDFGREHQKLVKAFLSRHGLSREQRILFKSLPTYLKTSTTVRLLEARRGRELAAFTVMDLGSADYGFYVFNFRSTKINVPGASDLLFHEMVKAAQAAGKQALNLGLGIHPGISRFKEKWGAAPFVSYASATIHKKTTSLGDLFEKL